jgi:hypothetical protein
MIACSSKAAFRGCASPKWAMTAEGGRNVDLCLAKTPSGRKMNLVLKSETVFEGDFRLRK